MNTLFLNLTMCVIIEKRGGIYLTKQEQNMIYQDIVFSHDTYSPIIFDSMYEMIEKTLNGHVNTKEILEKYNLTLPYIKHLKSNANIAKHTMMVTQYIKLHNTYIEQFNAFLTILKLPSIPIYQIEQYEYAPTELHLAKVIKQFHIIKLYEQFSVMYNHDQIRSLLRLQMFFESSIRYHANEYEKEFSYMINTASIMKKFVDYISDQSFSLAQQKTFVSRMMDLNKIRNEIKKKSNYQQTIEIDDLERYAMLISQKLEQEISPYDQPIFTSTQALLEYKNAFRELSFDYRIEVYKRLGEDVYADEIKMIYQNDLAYQVYVIQTIMEGLKMKRINDFEKIIKTIDQFEEMVNQLSKIGEQYSDVKETFDEVTNNIKDFNELNKKMAILSQVDFGKLSQFVNVQDDFDDGIKLSQVLTKFKERTEDIKEINKQVKELKKSMQLLQNKLDKEIGK